VPFAWETARPLAVVASLNREVAALGPAASVAPMAANASSKAAPARNATDRFMTPADQQPGLCSARVLAEARAASRRSPPPRCPSWPQRIISVAPARVFTSSLALPTLHASLLRRRRLQSAARGATSLCLVYLFLEFVAFRLALPYVR